MSTTLIHNVHIVNEGAIYPGSILIRNETIESIFRKENAPAIADLSPDKVIDGKGDYLIPGVIDDQVHFREPGLTHKGDIESESKAAVAGGITSYMEMPNTKPHATTIDRLEDKYRLAGEKSYANYSFYLGASNDNVDEIKKVNPETICGVKIFMGSSTGNMLVDNLKSLERIFAESPVLIATHCEDETTVNNNLSEYRKRFGDQIPVEYHPAIRSAEACYKSSSLAVALADRYGSRLHILHLSTAKELSLLSAGAPESKRVTAELCIHHLWFNDTDYPELGPKIKWNPAIKSAADQEALLKALIQDKIDVVATDHAPHLLHEKQMPYDPAGFNYLKAASGGPLVQHALPAMLECYHQKKISLETIVRKMCHAPARLFGIHKRGFIRTGYYADLVLIDLNKPWNVSRENILYKCGWSPFEHQAFRSSVTHTFINGKLAYQNGTFPNLSKNARRLTFSNPG